MATVAGDADHHRHKVLVVRLVGEAGVRAPLRTLAPPLAAPVVAPGHVSVGVVVVPPAHSLKRLKMIFLKGLFTKSSYLQGEFEANLDRKHIIISTFCTK